MLDSPFYSDGEEGAGTSCDEEGETGYGGKLLNKSFGVVVVIPHCFKVVDDEESRRVIFAQ